VKAKTKKYLLYGGGAALLLYVVSQRSKTSPLATAVPGFDLGGALSKAFAAVGAPLKSIFGAIAGQPSADAAGRYTFSSANGVTLKTTTPPPWVKGQVSGWSCWDAAGRAVPMGDPRCQPQIEAFAVLEGFERRRPSMGSLGAGGLGSLGRRR
jgi:hypothetical protein